MSGRSVCEVSTPCRAEEGRASRANPCPPARTATERFRRRAPCAKAAWLPLVAGFLAFTGGAVAQTDGTVTFTCTTSKFADPPHDPKNIVAIWVMNSSDQFVCTLERMALDQVFYLYKWRAQSNKNVVNAVTGATLSSHRTHSVTWNCRNASGVLVPDGIYRIRVEFTTKNVQGPYTTNLIQFVKGSKAVSTNFPDLPNLKGISLTYTPIIVPHDIAVSRLGAPRFANPDRVVAIPVVVTNQTTTTESFVVYLRNLTTGDSVGATFVASLPGKAETTVQFDWNTSGLALGPHTLEAQAGPLPGENDLPDNNLTAEVTLRAPTHDISLAILDAPEMVPPGIVTNLRVRAANLGDFSESFDVAVTDRTDRVLVGKTSISSLGPAGLAERTFAWSTTGASLGFHALSAGAGPVPEEMVTGNNSDRVSIAVAAGVETNVLIGRGSVWRYNDSGLDLHGGPWTSASYYDRHWPDGPAPFGYGQSALATTNGFGPDPGHKYPCYYFRRSFVADFPPLSAACRIRRDDGAAVFINGVEAFRHNLPAGPLAYSNWATAEVVGPDETNYFAAAISPSLFAVGNNEIAAEVHPSSSNSPDMSFDLELAQVAPAIPRRHDVAVSGVHPRGDATAGDVVTVDVAVRNAGNVAQSFAVTLTETNRNINLGMRPVSDLAAAQSAAVSFPWPTAGAAPGSYGLRATAGPVGGETNLTDNSSIGVGTVRSSGFALRAVNAVGSVGGFCSAVAADGGRLYVGEGATLSILDVSTSAVPRVLGRIRLPGMILSLASAGSFVYAAAGASGVHFVDCSSPGTPVHAQTFDTSGQARGVAVAGARLVVADGVSGVRIVNVANVQAPSLLGSFATEGPAQAVAVAGNTAYVLDGFKGLLILDISAPGSPSLVGAWGRHGFGEGLAVAGTKAYVVDGNSMLTAVDMADPSSPAVLGSLRLSSPGRAVALSGTFAYVAAGAAGLLVADVAAAAPTLAATVPLPGETMDVALSGTDLYVAGGLAGVQVMSLTNPALPAVRAVYDASARARDAAVAGGLAYVAAGEGGVRIYSVTNPAAATLVGVAASASNALRVALSSNVACVADGPYGVEILDVSNPSAPSHLARYIDPAMGAVHGVAVAGGRLALTDGHAIRLLDVSDPGSPAPGASYAAPGYVFELAMTPAVVLAAAGKAGLLVLDGATLSALGRLPTVDPATDVAAAGAVAYVAAGESGWLIVDVSNPSAPSLKSSLPGAGPVRHLALAGTRVHVTDVSDTMRSIDVSKPLTPVERARLGPLVQVLRATGTGPYVFASEDAAGMSIFDAAPGDHDVDGMPDSWEQKIVDADPNDDIRTVADVQPGADFDGDGLSNLGEYLAGTDPTDANSVFAVSSAAQSAGTQFVVQWHSVTDKFYTLYRSTNLREGFHVLKPDIRADPPLNTYTDTLTSAESAFYVVATQ